MFTENKSSFLHYYKRCSIFSGDIPPSVIVTCNDVFRPMLQSTLETPHLRCQSAVIMRLQTGCKLVGGKVGRLIAAKGYFGLLEGEPNPRPSFLLVRPGRIGEN